MHEARAGFVAAVALCPVRHHVALARSRDLRDPWQSTFMIEPTRADAAVAPFAGFPETWEGKGFQPNIGHWGAWDRNSNDADVCCADPSANGVPNGSYLAG